MAPARRARRSASCASKRERAARRQDERELADKLSETQARAPPRRARTHALVRRAAARRQREKLSMVTVQTDLLRKVRCAAAMPRGHAAATRRRH